MEKKTETIQPKLQEKNQKQEEQVNTKLRKKWTFTQAFRYYEFVQVNKHILQYQMKKEKQRVFNRMSSYVGTRTTHQCRSHHQKVLNRYKSIQNYVQKFRIKHKIVQEPPNAQTQKKNNLIKIQIQSSPQKVPEQINNNLSIFKSDKKQLNPKKSLNKKKEKSEYTPDYKNQNPLNSDKPTNFLGPNFNIPQMYHKKFMMSRNDQPKSLSPLNQVKKQNNEQLSYFQKANQFKKLKLQEQFQNQKKLFSTNDTQNGDQKKTLTVWNKGDSTENRLLDIYENKFTQNNKKLQVYPFSFLAERKIDEQHQDRILNPKFQQKNYFICNPTKPIPPIQTLKQSQNQIIKNSQPLICRYLHNSNDSIIQPLIQQQKLVITPNSISIPIKDYEEGNENSFYKIYIQYLKVQETEGDQMKLISNNQNQFEQQGEKMQQEVYDNAAVEQQKQVKDNYSPIYQENSLKLLKNPLNFQVKPQYQYKELPSHTYQPFPSNNQFPYQPNQQLQTYPNFPSYQDVPNQIYQRFPSYTDNFYHHEQQMMNNNDFMNMQLLPLPFNNIPPLASNPADATKNNKDIIPTGDGQPNNDDDEDDKPLHSIFKKEQKPNPFYYPLTNQMHKSQILQLKPPQNEIQEINCYLNYLNQQKKNKTLSHQKIKLNKTQKQQMKSLGFKAGQEQLYLKERKKWEEALKSTWKSR